jgi:Gluconate 2-dehydrogenase subunit 3
VAAVSRRAALKALGTGAGSVALLPLLSDAGLLAFGRIQATQAPPAPKLLSPSQFATLEAFVEAIIPADEHSPGAKEARVADYIDLLISEADESTALQWIGGLAELDEESRTRFQLQFSRLSPAQTDTMLAAISTNEAAIIANGAEPHTPLEAFFVTTKHAVIDGYYTSEIGIHRELRYRGNKFLNEFVGCETENGKPCPHCGQKPLR